MAGDGLLGLRSRDMPRVSGLARAACCRGWMLCGELLRPTDRPDPTRPDRPTRAVRRCASEMPEQWPRSSSRLVSPPGRVCCGACHTTEVEEAGASHAHVPLDARCSSVSPVGASLVACRNERKQRRSLRSGTRRTPRTGPLFSIDRSIDRRAISALGDRSLWRRRRKRGLPRIASRSGGRGSR